MDFGCWWIYAVNTIVIVSLCRNCIIWVLNSPLIMYEVIIKINVKIEKHIVQHEIHLYRQIQRMNIPISTMS